MQHAVQMLDQAHALSRASSLVSTVLGADDVQAASAVQEIRIARSRAAGVRVVGRKIGLVGNEADQACMRAKPVCGTLLAEMEGLDGATLVPNWAFAPRVEGKLAFVLGRDLSVGFATLADLVRAVEFVLPAAEVTESRMAGQTLTEVDLIADNAGAAMFVLGATPRKLEQLDLKLCGLTIERNGEPAGFGTGIQAYGHPLNALHWLARHCAAGGQQLLAGDIVLAPALGPAVAVAPGDDLLIEIGGLGSIAFHLSDNK